MRQFQQEKFGVSWRTSAVCTLGFVALFILTAMILLPSCVAERGPRLVPGPVVMPEAVDARYAPAATLYRQHCGACHGPTGEGDGRAASTFEVRPRAFRLEPFRFVSTTSGGAPSQDDLMRTIQRGIPHTEMPSMHLGDIQTRRLADYIREIRRLGIIDQLSKGSDAEQPEEPDDEYDEYGEDEDESLSQEEIEEIATQQVTPGPVTPVPLRREDYQSDMSVGRSLFAQNCAACHGPTGRGNGPLVLVDTLARPIRARDLTTGAFRGGSGDRDLYWRIRVGIPGTPMAGFSYLSDEQVWQLVDYVRHLSKGGT